MTHVMTMSQKQLLVFMSKHLRINSSLLLGQTILASISRIAIPLFNSKPNRRTLRFYNLILFPTPETMGCLTQVSDCENMDCY